MLTVNLMGFRIWAYLEGGYFLLPKSRPGSLNSRISQFLSLSSSCQFLYHRKKEPHGWAKYVYSLLSSDL